MAAAAVLAVAAGTSRAEPPENLEELRARALELVNRSRGEHDLPPLEAGAALNEAAQSHAADMRERDYYAHSGPEGNTVVDRYTAAGGSRWRLVEENIARCAECEPPAREADIERLHRGWMESPGHRRNILAEGLARFGFGIDLDPQQGLYAVQTFAGPGMPRSSASQDNAEDNAEALSAAEQVSLGSELVNEARREADAAPLQVSDALVATARSLLADLQPEEFTPQDIPAVTRAMPPDERDDWQALAMVAGACGGCGAEPTEANLRSFRRQWLDNPGYEDILLDPAASHIGIAMRADGSGRQIALAIVGTPF